MGETPSEKANCGRAGYPGTWKTDWRKQTPTHRGSRRLFFRLGSGGMQGIEEYSINLPRRISWLRLVSKFVFLSQGITTDDTAKARISTKLRPGFC